MRKLSIILYAVIMVFSCKNPAKKKVKEFTLFAANTSSQNPKIGDTIIYRYMLQVNDSIIYNSYKTDRPSIQGIAKQSHGGLDIYTALMKMSKGDSAVFYINADSFFNKTNFAPKPTFIPAGTDLKFSVKLEDIKNEAQMQEYRTFIIQNEANKEQIRIKKHMGKDSVNFVYENNVYAKINKKGTGGKSKNGETIEINLKGETHRGTLLVDTKYTGNSMKYQLGSGTIMPIVLEKIFADMKQGEIRTIIIPYEKAYGAKGFANVAPFSTLYYEVERL